MKRADATAALDKGHDGALASRTSLAAFGVGTAPALWRRLRVLLRAEVRFVDFDYAAVPAHGGKAAVTHCLANAVGQEPRGLVSHAENAVQLVRAYALF